MVIEPFNYQKRTNIEEHNQIVDKLNEVVDAVNNIDPNPSEFEQRIDALEQSAINQQNAIDGIHTRDALQDTEISSIKGKVTVNTNNIEQLETDTTSLDGRVTDIDGRLTTLAGNYTTLGGRVDSINTEVGQLSTQIGGLETGKVNVAQGTENAGKVLGIGADGNITPVEQSGGGGVSPPHNWTEINGSDVFTMIQNGEIGLGSILKVSLNITHGISSSSKFELTNYGSEAAPLYKCKMTTASRAYSRFVDIYFMISKITDATDAYLLEVITLNQTDKENDMDTSIAINGVNYNFHVSTETLIVYCRVLSNKISFQYILYDTITPVNDNTINEPIYTSYRSPYTDPSTLGLIK